jgi:hypothetical protein
MDAEEHNRTVALAQDKIGWRRCMEGMTSQSMVISQDIYRARIDTGWETGRWATGLVTKLLEVTHSQWLYQNLIVHDAKTGVLRTEQKEMIQWEIDKQLVEAVCGDLREKKVALYNDKESPTVSWVERLASRRPWVAAQLRLAPSHQSTSRGRKMR